MKLHDMGIPRKEMYPQPSETKSSEKDYDNEIVMPEVSVSGEHAKLLGAAKLSQGDRIPGELLVKKVVKTEIDGEERYEVVLCVARVGAPQKGDADESQEGSDDSGPDPALSYIERMAEKA